MMNDEKVTLAAGGLAVIIAVIMFVLMFAYFVFAGGYVLSVLWGWFITPVFVALPILTWQQAAGIMFVVNFLKHTIKGNEKMSNKRFFAALFLYPWIVLLLGYIVKIILF